MGPERNVLVVYAYRRFPLRTSVADHLYSFGRHAPPGCRVFYLNLGARSIPRYLRAIRFDLVVFHTLFLSARWRPKFFERLCERAAPLIEMSEVRAALPQDEFLDTEAVERFAERFDVQHVFSVTPPSEWPIVYPALTSRRVQLHEVLTGYLEPRTLQRVRALAAEDRPRDIDIGYRAWHAAPWLGSHGQLKVLVADRVARAAAARNLVTDMSTAEADTLFGDAWYRFMLRCRSTVGVEGGASILDRDGSLRVATERYLRGHPGASYGQVEAACFPGRDGEVAIHALSPRHLEACATRTCQLLVRGRYGGILEPGRHYHCIEPDLSNLEGALDALGDEALRVEMCDRAFEEVVASKRCHYSRFVQTVLETALPERAAAAGMGTESAARRCHRDEQVAWQLVRVAFGAWRRIEPWVGHLR